MHLSMLNLRGVENCLRIVTSTLSDHSQNAFISKYSQMYTSPDVVPKKTQLEVRKNVFKNIDSITRSNFKDQCPLYNSTLSTK